MNWKSEAKQVLLGLYLAAVLWTVVFTVGRYQQASELKRQAVEEAQLHELREIREKLAE